MSEVKIYKKSTNETDKRKIYCMHILGCDRGPYLNLAAFLGNQQFTASKIKELYLHEMVQI